MDGWVVLCGGIISIMVCLVIIVCLIVFVSWWGICGISVFSVEVSGFYGWCRSGCGLIGDFCCLYCVLFIFILWFVFVIVMFVVDLRWEFGVGNLYVGFCLGGGL